MNKAVREIRDAFEHYRMLLEQGKQVLRKKMLINRFKSSGNKRFLEHTEPVRHCSLADSISFGVDYSIINEQSYKFRLSSVELCSIPFFRFDSYGTAHRNNGPNIPLEEQLVTTPHFHKFDEQGQCIAYKTTQLQNPSVAKTLIEDINLCLIHFCHESNLRYGEDFPEIEIGAGGLKIEVIQQIDPLEDVDFE